MTHIHRLPSGRRRIRRPDCCQRELYLLTSSRRGTRITDQIPPVCETWNLTRDLLLLTADEFPQDIGQSGEGDVAAEALKRIACVHALVSFPKVRDAGGGKAAEDERRVELPPAAVPLSDEDAAHGIADPGAESRVVGSMIPGILVEHAGVGKFLEEICRGAKCKTPRRARRAVGKELARIVPMFLVIGVKGLTPHSG